MVYDPPRKMVDVSRIVIYSFVPILAIYAAWRIQKFWLLLLINVGLGYGTGIAVGAILSLSGGPLASASVIVFGMAIQIAVSVLVVRHYANRYNEKIAVTAAF